MSDKILVTYATLTGSTTGVAEAIGKTLAERGASVDVRPMQDVTDLTPYRAVVAGSAINAKEWLPDAMTWVQTHRAALNARPFAAFLVCMTLVMNNEQARASVYEWLDPVAALVQPVSKGFFAGHLDISKIPYRGARFGFRASVLAGVWKEGDHRNWDAIHAWAAELAGLL